MELSLPPAIVMVGNVGGAGGSICPCGVGKFIVEPADPHRELSLIERMSVSDSSCSIERRLRRCTSVDPTLLGSAPCAGRVENARDRRETTVETVVTMLQVFPKLSPSTKQPNADD